MSGQNLDSRSEGDPSSTDEVAAADPDHDVGEIAIQVFADIICPFAHVGLRRFVEMRDELGRQDVRLYIRSWPLELVNQKMPDPHFIAEEIEEIRTQVAPDLFRGFDPDVFPTTSIPALALVCRAYDVDLATGEAVSLELRDLMFDQGRDISDRTVLAELAQRHGLPPEPAGPDPASDRAVVARDYEEGGIRGVMGSPHFFTPSGDFFCPALEIRRDSEGCLHVGIDIEGFRSFMSSCLL